MFPLDSGYVNGYYDEVLGLIRTFLSSSCKDNPYLRLAVHTGCLRIAGESIYTGFNNPYINTILNRSFNTYYGFTPEEVQTMLDYYELGDMMPRVKDWYDGYLFGGQDIYNPWNILNCVSEARENPDYVFDTYWANTSGNDLLLKLIDCSLDGNSSRNDIERLLEGEAVVHAINKTINYNRIGLERDAVWNILFFTGYLKSMVIPNFEGNSCEVPLMLVNKELWFILKDNVKHWYQQLPVTGQLQPLVNAMEDGETAAVEAELNRLLMRTVSFRDRAENYYHGFLAGLLAGLDNYRCLSNREAGEGVSDIRLERLDRRSATVIEIKMAKSPEDLERMAAAGLKQSIETGYADEYRILKFGTIHVYGIACFGKKCKVMAMDVAS